MSFRKVETSSRYLADQVASTVESFGGVSQHLQNLLMYGSEPSAKHFIDIHMPPDGSTLTVHADLHNAPTSEDARKYIGILGNKEGMVVTPGSNEKGHGAKAGFQADCKVGVLGVKAGERYILGLPQTSAMVDFMRTQPLQTKEVFNGEIAAGAVVFAHRTNGLDKPVGVYDTDWLIEEDPEEAYYGAYAL
jgi:hypothetical protein